MADYVLEIAKSGLSIYDSIEVGDPKLWIPTIDLEKILDEGMVGFDLSGLANKTRSKVIKQRVCDLLKYPVPKSFKRTKPRFVGQNFDVYGQKSNNLQIWNDEISLTRRYVLVRIEDSGVVCQVKVISGDELALLDKTGTLTKKYQARLVLGSKASELLVPKDTPSLAPHISNGNINLDRSSPIDHPEDGFILPIAEVFRKLEKSIGVKFEDQGSDQERNRGAALHKIACEVLGYNSYQDTGQFPDIRHQLIEIKLQTATTIDLGLVLPTSEEPLDMPKLKNTQAKACDTRYAIFYGDTDGEYVTLTHLYVTTGEKFFDSFPQFGGNVINGKLQIPLPAGFFRC